MFDMRACLIFCACLGAGCVDFGSVGSDWIDDSAGGTSSIGGSGGTFPQNPPTLSVQDAHPVLGETTAVVLVTLSHPWQEAISVNATTVDGTALGDASGAGDYQPVTQLLQLPAGATKAELSIPVQSPYTSLTLDSSLSKEFAVQISSPSGGATLADPEGRVTLAQAGMVIETPLMQGLYDGDVIPNFNGDQRQDLLLTGTSGRGVVLLTPDTTFEESTHVSIDATYPDGQRAFTFAIGSQNVSGETVTSDQSMAYDFNHDGTSDVLTIVDGKYRILYGHFEPFAELEPGSPELTDGSVATELSDLGVTGNLHPVQTGDWDGDGLLDWAQAHWQSSASGGVDAFWGYYGALGPYPGVVADTSAFSFVSGVPHVGQGSQSGGTRSGVRADLNGDARDDILFIGEAANDGLWGGQLVYVKFSPAERFDQQNVGVRDTFDGTNGFQFQNPYQASSAVGIEDAGDVNDDAIDDLVLTGGGEGVSVIFGKKSAFGSGSFASLADFAAGAVSFPQSVLAAGIGDVNSDGIGDLVTLSSSALVIVWGRPDFSTQDLALTQYPNVGTLPVDPNSAFNQIISIADLDGDEAAEVILSSSSWASGTGGALVLFGKTLTRALGGPNLDRAPPR